MNKIIGFLKVIILSLFLTSPFFADAQVTRTIASTRGNSVEFIQIYEFNSVDEQPMFPGGNMALMHFINNERQYPKEAYQNGIQGRVVCGFVVNEDGRISDISVMKSVEPTLDLEAMRIISVMPPWIAGMIDHHPVPVFCVLAIPFRR